jgi:hypothetical protein
MLLSGIEMNIAFSAGMVLLHKNFNLLDLIE